jgi:hypothetical protein
MNSHQHHLAAEMRSEIMKQKLRLLTLTAATFLLGTSPMMAQPIANNSSSQPSVPTTKYKGATVPDFQRITFGSFPAVDGSGSFKIPGQGTVSFKPGDKATDVLTLGSIKDLGADKLTLGTTSKRTGVNLDSKTLADFPLLKTQSVGDLVKAIPGLGDRPVKEVKPVFDLLKRDAGSSAALGKLGPNAPISQVLQQTPGARNVPLGKLDLKDYPLLSLNGIENAPIGNFQGARSAQLSQFLGIDDIPLGDFPNPLDFAGGVGTVDVVYGEKEANRKNTITGGDQVGFEVPCEQKNCSYIELSGNPIVHGKQWISGKSQEVEGGFGTLKMLLNGGKEPTGRLPYTNSLFKLAMTKVTESKGTAEFAWYMHFCTTMAWGEYTCTPYAIGPFPWITSKEKETIFLGIP